MYAGDNLNTETQELRFQSNKDITWHRMLYYVSVLPPRESHLRYLSSSSPSIPSLLSFEHTFSLWIVWLPEGFLEIQEAFLLRNSSNHCSLLHLTWSSKKDQTKPWLSSEISSDNIWSHHMQILTSTKH